MLLKPSGWMRLALTAGIALTSLASIAADPVKIGLLEDASGNFALATIPKIHATPTPGVVVEYAYFHRTWNTQSP